MDQLLRSGPYAHRDNKFRKIDILVEMNIFIGKKFEINYTVSSSDNRSLEMSLVSSRLASE